MTSTIDVHQLAKSYGAFPAVQDVSFSVRSGEVYCLLGPNGAGKTTTTEILEGYRDRTAGEVRVLGFDPAHHPRELRQRVGIVLQECGIQGDLTVAEVLDLYGRYAPRRRSIGEVVELVELDAKTTDRVKHLSGGQRRRLDVGLAIIGCPDIVFLDEPTTGFDPAARRSSWSMIRSLSDLGTTVLLTTHFMDEAEALADRIGVVVAGRLIAEGTPATLGGRHQAPAVIEATIPASAVSPPDLPGATVTQTGSRVRIVTDSVERTLHAITGWAIDQQVTLPDLAVARPSLEDIYLQLTANTIDTRVPQPRQEAQR